MKSKKSKDVDLYLKHTSKQLRDLMIDVRAIIWKAIPDVEESIKYTVPFYSRQGLLCYLSPLKKKDGIYIGFAKGYLMSDESGIFSGKSLKYIRHIELRNKSEIKKKLLKEYLEEAVMFNEMKKGKNILSI
ncbi:MAG: DUF1801 domain-containing protein [Bacteroidota bacterium]|nr:DUF1801 domain-containing protein [Bacteroidota bacterium]